MARNYKYEGDVLQHTPSSAVASGQLLIIGGMAAVALNAIAANDTGSVAVEGVFTLDKSDTGTAYDQGAEVYFDGTNLTLAADDGGSPATPYDKVGRVASPAATAATVVDVKLNR